MNPERIARPLLRAGLVAALGGGAAAVWGYLSEPREFFVAWLAAFYFWLSMPLGALALLLIWDLTGGRWEPIARLPLNAMAATMPLFVPLFVPVIAGLAELYSWTRPQVGASLHNHWYLNSEFFFIRAAAYFLIWNGFAGWRLLRDRSAPPAQAVSALGVMLLGYTVAFAGIDWIMSTEPDWFSSIYGMVVGSGQFVAALSFALVLITFSAPAQRASEPAFGAALATLATILLAVVIFWAYTSFCQWLIIWEENLRTEIRWFIERWRQPWGSVIYALVAAHFVIPFLALVWTPAKRKATVVGAVCLLLILADVLNVWWLLLPGLTGGGFSWLDPAVMIAIGGLWLLAVAGALRLTGGEAFRQRSGGLAHG
jgi:hypothetical protein